ncbi:MAG: DNA-processing protein DprA [Methylophilales bacterium]|nr:DNA-processing protein DprA [Methylophilales bacterium]
MLDAEEARYWIALSLISGLGGENYRRLLSAFGDPEQIYATPISHLRDVVDSNISSAITQGIDEEKLAPAMAWLAQPNNRLLTLADSDYPQTLLEISDPPPVLYLKGDVTRLNQPCLAVVGSRNASPQGLNTAEAFSQALADAGWCVVSGMALGIDGAAHKGALKGKASTVAVVGTGLDIVYPSRHRDLAHEIAQKGAMISEFPLATPSIAGNFPRRNRIISGLARGVLIVEANLQSGSLITARLAGEQGREVFAIPGSIHSPLSKGCHLLIKQGAKLVDSIHDILEELGTAPISQLEESSQGEELPLLTAMGYEAVAAETLIQRCSLTSEQVSAMLLTLELDGRIASLPGGRYQRLN